MATSGPTGSEPSEPIVCCNPFNKHKRKNIFKNLRKISTFDVVCNSNLIAGKYWCDNCRKHKVDPSATQGFEATTSSAAAEENDEPSGGALVSEDSKICCNPFNRHLNPSAITRNLRVIKEADAQGNQDLVGCYWCNSCRLHKKNTQGVQSHTDDSAGTTAETFDDRAALHEDECSEGAVEEKASEDTLGEKTTEEDALIEIASEGTLKEIATEDTGEEKDSEGSEREKTACSNPFGIHSKTIYKGLRAITEADKQKHNSLSVGLFWCDTCRKVAPAACDDQTSSSEPSSQEVGVGSQNSGTSVSPSLSPVVLKESASRKLVSLGLSPLATNTLKSGGSKVSAVKRKAEEATSAITKKISLALGVNEENIETTEARKAKDHDILMDEVKQRIPTASKVLKYQLLSLVPLSLSIREGAQQFGVSRTMFTLARRLKEEKGIIPVPDFSRTSSVSAATKAMIVEFYCSDANSKIMPGLRDCVSIRKGVYEQKRLLLSNLPELYQAFKEDNEGLKVGKSVFWSLKPKWCVSASEAGTHEQCVCQTHQNFKLVCYALNIKTHYRDLIPLCVCNAKDRSCMLRLCENCPTLESIQEILKGQIERPDFLDAELSSGDEYDFLDESVKFRQWKASSGKTEMVVQICSRIDLIEIAAKQMCDLIPHDFISCSQRDYLKNLKENLPASTAIIAMDFSMNFNCLIQGAVQSYHWSPKQATVHPTVIYYRNSDNVVTHKSLIFISDDTDHDVPLVKKIQQKTIAYLKENLPQIEEVIYSTDGCASQYKCKGYFKDLCNHEAEFGIKASHSHFATSHGKSLCDACGGSVKRKARMASLQRPLDNQIINAQDLFAFCEEEMSDKFVFMFITKQEVEPLRKLYQESLESIETLPGTRTFHFFRPLTENTIACWKVSNDQNEEPSLIHNLQKISRTPAPVLAVSSGMYLVVRLAKSRYLAFVTDVYEEEGEIDVSILMPRLPAKVFKWPKEMKTATVPLPHVLCETQPLETNNTFSFSTNDLEKLYSLKIMKRPS